MKNHKAEQDSILQPSVDETSRKIVEEKFSDRKNQHTYQRLYDLNKERMQKQAQNILNETDLKNQTQSVQLSKRDKPLDTMLYEDAERRRVEHDRLVAEYDKVKDKPKEGKYYNDNSDKYVAQRLERELKQMY